MHVWNTVQKIKAMSKVSKVHYTDFNALNVCVCSFPIFDIFDIHSITALRCIWSIFDIFSMLWYTQYLMVCLKSSKSQLSKTFCGLKIGWILRKLWAKMCVYVLFPSLMSSTYTALQPLGVFDLSSTSSTCFNIHSIWWYGWKALSLSFPNHFVDWKSVEY